MEYIVNYNTPIENSEGYLPISFGALKSTFVTECYVSHLIRLAPKKCRNF